MHLLIKNHFHLIRLTNLICESFTGYLSFVIPHKIIFCLYLMLYRTHKKLTANSYHIHVWRQVKNVPKKPDAISLISDLEETMYGLQFL